VGGEARPWEELEALLVAADVVVSSTAAKEPIVTRALMKKVVKARRYRPLFIVDIAVPRDVEKSVGDLEGVYLFDVDDLERVAADNLADRAGAAVAGERIVEAETAQFLAWQRSQGAVPTIKDLRERFHKIAAAEVEKTLPSLHLEPGGEAAVRQLAEAIVQKLLHQPLTALKSDDPELVPAARRLFALGDTPKKP
jgi:glutamyl-tRNA reductase